jgi:hypothetical protein
MSDGARAKQAPIGYTSGVPAIRKSDNTKGRPSKKIMNIVMMACCIPMVIGGALIFYSIPSDLGLGARLYALAPLAGCVAMHFVMHRFMGKSCHEKSVGKDEQ